MIQIPFIYIPKPKAAAGPDTSAFDAVIANYRDARILHLDSTIWDGSGNITDKCGNTFINHGVTKSEGSFYFDDTSYMVSQSLGSETAIGYGSTTNYPMYFILFNPRGNSQIIGKNASRTSGTEASGRYLTIRSNGGFNQRSNLFTGLSNNPVYNGEWNSLVYARWSNSGSQQRKIHTNWTTDSTADFITAIYNQSTITYANNQDEFLVGKSPIESTSSVGYIKEIALFDGSGFSDGERLELAQAYYGRMKAIQASLAFIPF